MQKLFTTLVLAAALAATARAAEAPDADPVARATALFTAYETGERAFDPAVADLYCDEALIRNTRTLPDGSQQVMEVDARRYKAMVRAAMPVARERGDYNNYEDVTIVAVAGGVRIAASRHSLLKDYRSPISILAGECAGGGYGILEEISESRP